MSLPLSHSEYLATHNFQSLDGLRCLSIMAVIAAHCQCFRYGFLGVNLFFAISGFLITTLLLRERAKHHDISLRSFYARRSLRIFPLYYAVLLIYMGSVLFFKNETLEGRLFWDYLPSYLTYTCNWFLDYENEQRVVFSLAWSLAAEEQFYAVWPSVEKHIRGKTLWGVLAGIFIASQAASLIPIDGDSGILVLIVRILRKIPIEILGGVALAHLLHSSRTYTAFSRLIGGKWTSSVLLVLLILGIFYFPAVIFLRFWAIALLMVAFLGSCVVRADHSLSWFLNLRTVKHIGVVSYGIYLMNQLCKNSALVLFRSLKWPQFNFLVFFVTVVISVAVASLSYRYYERWFLNLKTRFSR